MRNLDAISTNFATNVSSVYDLMEFDRVVLDYAVQNVAALREKLVQHHQFDNPHLTAENTLLALRNIQQNNSLRPKYGVIFNQCIVLLVSYFASAVGDVFRRALTDALMTSPDARGLKQEIRMTLGELKVHGFDLREAVGDIVATKRDISFQDMQSIARAFEEFLGIPKTERDQHVNNIVLAQGCRHVIVHAGGRADRRLLHQLRDAEPRDLKLQIAPDEPLQFSTEEVRIVGVSMSAYLANIITAIRATNHPVQTP